MRTAHSSLLPALLLSLIVACNRGSDFGSGDVDTALLTRAGGDVLLAGGGRLPYEITSERYRQWDAARRALRAQRITLNMRLDPMRVSEAEIESAIRFFDRNGKARRAIEGTGLSVRDYVLTTIALEQQMAVASRRPRAPQQPREPRPLTPAESIAAQLARDSARTRVDTVPVVDTVVIPVDPVPPDTTPLRPGGPPRR